MWERKLINTEGMIEIENHYWRTTIEVVDQKEVIGGDLMSSNKH